MHHREERLDTNTAFYLTKLLPNSTIIKRGLKGEEELDLQLGTPPYKDVLLYPTEQALSLDEIIERPIHLIIPDGSWRQASKVAKREKALEHTPRIKIQGPKQSLFHLRKAPQPYYLCTFEACAYALGELEGPEIKGQMLKIFETVVYHHLKSRGKVSLLPGNRKSLI